MERRVPAHDERRHQLGDLVADGVGVAEHPGGVAHRRPGLDGREGHDLGDVVGAVALGGVADHLAPVALVEVHVDVGHLLATGVEEALEQQVVADGVEVHDAQAVGHAAARGRASPRSHPDARLAGVADEVPHHQEVGGEAHVADDAELELEALHHLRPQGVAIALAGALEGQVAQVVVVAGEAHRQGEGRELGLAELDLHPGPLGHPERVVAGLRCLGEEMAHLGRGLEVVLRALELEALGIVDGRARLHAQEGVVGHGVVAVGVVAVVGGQQRGRDPPRDLHELGVGLALLGQAVVLKLHEEVVATEDVLEAPGQPGGLLLVSPQQGLEHNAAQAAGGGHHALVVAFEQLPVQPGLVEVALQIGGAGELHEIAVALGGLGQQGQVVVELLALLALSTGVVDSPPAHGALMAGLGRHVGLHPDHGGDVLLPAGLVEVEDPVHVPVVGDAHRGLTVGLGRGDDVGDPGGPVQHGELGVEVEVGEGTPR